jgi:hypothetical protein
MGCADTAAQVNRTSEADRSGLTLLHCAATSGSVQVCSALPTAHCGSVPTKADASRPFHCLLACLFVCLRARSLAGDGDPAVIVSVCQRVGCAKRDLRAALRGRPWCAICRRLAAELPGRRQQVSATAQTHKLQRCSTNTQTAALQRYSTNTQLQRFSTNTHCSATAQTHNCSAVAQTHTHTHTHTHCSAVALQHKHTHCSAVALQHKHTNCSAVALQHKHTHTHTAAL